MLLVGWSSGFVLVWAGWYRLITLPLAGAAGLEPWAVEGAVEVAMVEMCRRRCGLKREVWY